MGARLTRIRVTLLVWRAAWEGIVWTPSTARCIAAAERALARLRDLPAPPATLVARAATVLARRLWQAGRLEEAAERAREAVLAAADGPAVVRAVAHTLQARVLLSLGQHEEALAAAESAVMTCRTAPRRSARLPRELTWALYQQSVILTELDRYEEALSACEQALAVMAAVPRRRSWWRLDVRWRVQCLYVELLGRVGRPEEAVALGTRLVTRLDGLPSRADPTSVLPRLARLRAHLAMSHAQLGHPDQAVVLSGQSVAGYRALGESHREHLAWSLTRHATQLSALGRHQEADAAWSEAGTIYGELADADPARYRGVHVHALGERANAVWRRDEEASVEASVAAVSVLRRHAADDPGAFGPDLVTMLAVTAARAATLGRAEALEYADEAVREARGLADGPDAQLVVARARYFQGFVLGRHGRLAEAIEPLREAVALLRRLAESDLPRHADELMRAVGLLGAVLHRLDRVEEAAELWHDIVAFLRPRATAADIEGLLAEALENLGMAYGAGQRHDDGIAVLIEAVGYRRRRADQGERPAAALARALRQRSAGFAALGRPDEARRDLAEATAILRRLADRDPGRYGAELERTVAQAGHQDPAARSADR